MKFLDFVDEFTVPEQAEKGKDFKVFDGITFKLKSFQSKDVQKYLAKIREEIDVEKLTNSKNEEDFQEYLIKLLSGAIVCGWEGIEDLPFSQENCVKLLNSASLLINKLYSLSNELSNFRNKKK